MLWERDGRLTAVLATERAAYPAPDLQWIEDRIWPWVHYMAGKIARGELFETLDGLGFVRARVLGPLAARSSAARSRTACAASRRRRPTASRRCARRSPSTTPRRAPARCARPSRSTAKLRDTQRDAVAGAAQRSGSGVVRVLRRSGREPAREDDGEIDAHRVRAAARCSPRRSRRGARSPSSAPPARRADARASWCATRRPGRTCRPRSARGR